MFNSIAKVLLVMFSGIVPSIQNYNNTFYNCTLCYKFTCSQVVGMIAEMKTDKLN